MLAVLGLGSNLGDRAQILATAVGLLRASMTVERVSPSYETPPWGFAAQPDFLNAAVLVRTELSPAALLDAALRIERALGRDRSVDVPRFGPRTIDIDVLWIDGLAVNGPTLVVPHPRLEERDFALLPLLDVAPDAKHPTSGVAYSDIVAKWRAEGRSMPRSRSWPAIDVA